MAVIADSREKVAHIVNGCDEQRLLSYPNPESPAHPRSYDYEIHTVPSGHIWTPERKTECDALGSWFQRDRDGRSKLDRQIEAAGCLILEWCESRENREVRRHSDSIKRRGQFRALRKHINGLAMQGYPIIWTSSEQDTLEHLRYIESKDLPMPRPR